MNKRNIDPLDYASDIMKGLKKSALVTTRRGDEVNTMTVAWGFFGIEWNRLIVNALIRRSRHTHDILEDSTEFALSIPLYGSVTGPETGKIMGHCGSKSGRDTDKVADLGLTLVPGENIGVPGILEVPLTLECRILYRQDQDLTAIPPELLEQYYPLVSGDGPNAVRDGHTMYFGEVLGAYILEK